MKDNSIEGKRYLCVYKEPEGYYVLYRRESGRVYFDCYDNNYQDVTLGCNSSTSVRRGTHRQEVTQLDKIYNKYNKKAPSRIPMINYIFFHHIDLIPIKSSQDLDKYFMVQELMK